MKVVKLKVEDITPYENNARINDETVVKLKVSLDKYGYVVPIIVDINNVVVAGHARLKAVAQLGWEEIDCIVSDLSDEKNNEFRILDNKIQEISGWDIELLSVELRALDDIALEFSGKIKTALTDGFSGLMETEESVSVKKDKLDKAYLDMSEVTSGRIVDIKCHQCGKEFGVDRREFG